LSVALHPGGIATELQSKLPAYQRVAFSLGNVFMKSVEQGAATSVYCCTAPEVESENLGGNYFSDSNVAVPASHASDPLIAKRLWEESEKMTSKKFDW